MLEFLSALCHGHKRRELEPVHQFNFLVIKKHGSEEVFWLIGLDAPIMENAFQIHFKILKKLDKKFLVYI
jgi:hypothetical protein